jgi:rpsU-divergently transcribed protein
MPHALVVELAVRHDEVIALWRTASAMWYAAGDTSTDFSYYSRRVLLAGVYASTLLYWLGDDSEDCADTWSFLDRRIANVMAIPKLKPSALAERLAPSVAKALLKALARDGD